MEQFRPLERMKYMDTATIAQTALTWVWPQTCAHCRWDLPASHEGPLCGHCRQLLVPAEPPYCWRCAEPLKEQRRFCLACANRPFSCRLIRAAFRYHEAAVSVVHAFKFRGRRSAARRAGFWMAALLERFPELSGADFLVPMPLHKRRRRERGYNQAFLLAEELSTVSGIPILEAAIRVKDTRPLWAQGRDDRRKSLLGAFACAAPVEGKSLLVIDDVCTTGASLEACARALLGAGAAQVNGYVFARQGSAT